MKHADILEDGRRRADGVRLFVTTAWAFRHPRLPYFIEMIRCLVEMPVPHITFSITVNTFNKKDLEVAEKILQVFRSTNRIFILNSFNETFTYELCWAHKSLFDTEFFPGNFTHFLYLEDDIRFTVQNMYYFLGSREILSEYGLIPSFVRFEWNVSDAYFYATDQNWEMDLSGRTTIGFEDFYFGPLDSTYCAMYLLDRDLAFEYRNSRSFHRENSKEVFGWEISERAAMGLAFERIPANYYSRYVLLIDGTRNCPAICTWVHHLPGNFTNDPNSQLGRRRMDSLIRP